MLPKSILLALAAIAAVLATAINPLERDVIPESGITWTGRIFKTDTEMTTLQGEASEIYAQILARNPAYVASEINAENAVTVLEKRGESRTCGAIAVGTLERSIEAAKYLKKLGGSCGAPSRACRRMTCKDTTASYICGERSAVSIPCSTAGHMVNDIVQNCCQNYRAGRSGHIYVNRDYSIWLGYGNCSHANTDGPHTYPYPGEAVNGYC